jgi:hypothetical protein
MSEWSKGDVPDGWWNLVGDIDAKMMFLDPEYVIAQVKEKFGELRFYFATDKEGLVAEIMRDVAHQGEARSRHICETCGKYGELRALGWMRTLCTKHYMEVTK